MNKISPPTQFQMFGGDMDQSAKLDVRQLAVLALATLLSLAILWFSTGNIILVGSCAAVIIASGALIHFFRHAGSVEDVVDVSPPDWSIAHAATQLSDAAIAISDRAGQLLCANDHFTKAFPGLKAPPDLGLDESSQSLMVAAGRAAWRDGSAQIDTITKDQRAYSVKVARAGASDEYLLWKLAPIERIAIESLAIELITGRIGRAMSGSGVMAVAVGPDGCVRAANAAFALRATGTDQVPLTGRSFADFVRMDDKGSVFFEREGRRGLPIRLLHVPLNAHDVEGSALLLAVDEDGAKVDRGLALAHVEQLLSTLPLGLALVDRDGRFLFANDAFARVLDVEPTKLPPYPGDLVISEDKGVVLDSIRRYGSGPKTSGDIAIRLKERPMKSLRSPSLACAGLVALRFCLDLRTIAKR